MCVTYDSYYGVFDYINVGQSDACSGNALKDSAIARSSGGGGTLWYRDGRLAASGINVTDNYCEYRYSGIVCDYVINASISFSAFSNNTCDGFICFDFEDRNNKQYNEMHACNVIDNKQMDYSSWGTIYCWNSYLTITDSYINNNVAERDFYCGSGSITIKNSVINTSKTTSGTVSCIQCNASGVRIDLDFEDDCYFWMFQQFNSFSTICSCVQLNRPNPLRKENLIGVLYV